MAKNDDGSFRELDWCLVNTSIGACAEPKSRTYADPGLTVVDLTDMPSFNRILEVDEALMYSMLGTYGPVLAEVTLHNPVP
jgi:hypothetical protein